MHDSPMLLQNKMKKPEVGEHFLYTRSVLSLTLVGLVQLIFC